MKEKIFCSILFLMLISISVYAADGDFTVEGNFGAGTLSPQGKLDTEDIVYDVGAGSCPGGIEYVKGDFDGEADADDCRATGIVAKANGDVGIGTTNPNYKFHIHTNKSWGYLQFTTKLTGTGNDDGFFWGIEGNEAYFWADTGMPIYLYPGGGAGTQTVFRENGNVGIGTSNPKSRLAVSGLPNEPPAGSTNQGIVCITTDGDMWIDDDGTFDCQ